MTVMLMLMLMLLMRGSEFRYATGVDEACVDKYARV